MPTAPKLVELLQRDYSVALYGDAQRVPRHPRIVWLNLLPPDALALVARIGLCTLDAAPPLRPFFTIPDAIGDGNQLDAAWVANDAAAHARAMPSHSWVEVTHCPQRIVHRHVDDATCDAIAAGRTNRQRYNCAMSREPWRWQWRAGSLWLFAAAGSGVSVNIGRTRVVETFREAELFLRNRVVETNGSWTTGCGRATLKHESTGGGALLDSVQILARKEAYSRELRHEILMLGHGECEPLTAQMPFVRCGRPPNLRRCSHGDAALARIARCGSAADVRKRHSGGFVNCRSHRSNQTSRTRS